MTTAVCASELEALLLEELQKDPACWSVARVQVEAICRPDGEPDWDAKAYYEDGTRLGGLQHRIELIAKARLRQQYDLIPDQRSELDGRG